MCRTVSGYLVMGISECIYVEEDFDGAERMVCGSITLRVELI